MDANWSPLLNEYLRLTRQQESITALQQQLLQTFDRLTQRLTDISNRQQSEAWITQEALTLVLSEHLAAHPVGPDRVDDLFDLMMGSGLHRLALILVNQQQAHLSPGECHLKRSISLFQLGERQQAQTEIEQAMALMPEHHLCHFHHGYQLIWQGEMERAVTALEHCLTLNPDYAAAHQNLAGCLYQISEFERAQSHCLRAHELKPGIPATYITAASANLALQCVDQAQWWLDQAAAQKLESAEFLRLQGMVSHFQQNHQDAVEKLSQYLELHPRSYDLVAIRARSLLAQQRWPQLQQDTETLLQLDPYDEWCLEKLALALYHNGELQRAEQALTELARLYPSYKHLHRDLLSTIRRQGAIPLRVEQ